MNFTLCQRISHRFSSRLGGGSDVGLPRDTMGLILFLQQILLICFDFSVKDIIFVELFPYRKVFALVYVQFDRRKLPAGYFKLHRLLYFTRAVDSPTRRQP